MEEGQNVPTLLTCRATWAIGTTFVGECRFGRTLRKDRSSQSRGSLVCITIRWEGGWPLSRRAMPSPLLQKK